MRAIPALFRLLAVALLLAGCGAKATPPAPPDPAGAPAPAPVKAHAPYGLPEEDEPWPMVPRESESPEDAAQRARLTPLARRIDRALFKDNGCVSYIQEAGRDRKGQELLVVTVGDDCLVPPPPAAPSPFGSGRLDLGPPPEPGQEPPAPEPEAPASDEKEEAEEEECTPYKYYLVARKGTQVRPVALLSEACVWGENTAFGLNRAHSVEVDKESQTFKQNEMWGGASAGGSTVRVGLNPLRIAGVSSEKTMNPSEDVDGMVREWDADALNGTVAWGAIDCKEQARLEAAARGARDAGAPDGRDSGESGESGESGGPVYEIEAALIPFVALPADFIAQGWRTTRLTGCSAEAKYTLHGESNASLLAVIAGGGEGAPVLLFVEVTDDRFVGPGRSWVTDDHLELWVGDAKLGSERECGKESAEWSAQWGIRVADGAVFPAHGAPPPLEGVERVVAGRTARFKIPLAGKAGLGARITVVYSDSDDGRRQKGLIGTSQLRFGDPATLGESAGPGRSCVVKRGVLQPVPVLIEPSLSTPVTKDQ